MNRKDIFPLKYYLTFGFLMLFTIGMSIFYFSGNYMEYKSEMEVLILKNINGYISVLKNENRGSYYIEIRSLEEIHKIHSMPLAGKIQKYDIQVGDSISKKVNSNIIIFYKKINGDFIEVCKFYIDD